MNKETGNIFLRLIENQRIFENNSHTEKHPAYMDTEKGNDPQQNNLKGGQYV